MKKLLRIVLLAALCLALGAGALAEREPPGRTEVEVLDSAFDGLGSVVVFRLTPVDPEHCVLFNPEYQEQDDELYVYEKRELIPFPMLYRRDGKTILRYSPHITSPDESLSWRVLGVDEEEDGSLVLYAYGQSYHPRSELRLDVAARVMIFDVLYETDAEALELTAKRDDARRISEWLTMEEEEE